MGISSKQSLLRDIAPERPVPGRAFRDALDTIFHRLDEIETPATRRPTSATSSATSASREGEVYETDGVWSVAAEDIGRDMILQLESDGAHPGSPSRFLPPAGFAAASVRAGERLFVRRSGESSPLTVPFPEGTVLYLGAGGLPRTTPPAEMSVQIGIATRRGFLYQPGPAILPEGA